MAKLSAGLQIQIRNFKLGIADRNGDRKLSDKENALFLFTDFGKEINEALLSGDLKQLDELKKTYADILEDKNKLNQASAVAAAMYELDTDGNGVISKAEAAAKKSINQNAKNIFTIMGDDADENIFDFAHMERYALLVNTDGNYDISATEANKFGELVAKNSKDAEFMNILKKYLAGEDLSAAEETTLNSIKAGTFVSKQERDTEYLKGLFAGSVTLTDVKTNDEGVIESFKKDGIEYKVLFIDDKVQLTYTQSGKKYTDTYNEDKKLATRALELKKSGSTNIQDVKEYNADGTTVKARKITIAGGRDITVSKDATVVINGSQIEVTEGTSKKLYNLTGKQIFDDNRDNIAALFGADAEITDVVINGDKKVTSFKKDGVQYTVSYNGDNVVLSYVQGGKNTKDTYNASSKLAQRTVELKKTGSVDIKDVTEYNADGKTVKARKITIAGGTDITVAGNAVVTVAGDKIQVKTGATTKLYNLDGSDPEKARIVGGQIYFAGSEEPFVVPSAFSGYTPAIVGGNVTLTKTEGNVTTVITYLSNGTRSSKVVTTQNANGIAGLTMVEESEPKLVGGKDSPARANLWEEAIKTYEFDGAQYTANQIEVKSSKLYITTGNSNNGVVEEYNNKGELLSIVETSTKGNVVTVTTTNATTGAVSVATTEKNYKGVANLVKTTDASGNATYKYNGKTLPVKAGTDITKTAETFYFQTNATDFVTRRTYTIATGEYTSTKTDWFVPGLTRSDSYNADGSYISGSMVIKYNDTAADRVRFLDDSNASVGSDKATKFEITQGNKVLTFDKASGKKLTEVDKNIGGVSGLNKTTTYKADGKTVDSTVYSYGGKTIDRSSVEDADGANTITYTQDLEGMTNVKSTTKITFVDGVKQPHLEITYTFKNGQKLTINTEKCSAEVKDGKLAVTERQDAITNQPSTVKHFVTTTYDENKATVGTQNNRFCYYDASGKWLRSIAVPTGATASFVVSGSDKVLKFTTANANSISGLTKTVTYDKNGLNPVTVYTYKGKTISVPNGASLEVRSGNLYVTATSTTTVGASGGSNYVKVCTTYNATTGDKGATQIVVKAGDNEYTLNNVPDAFVGMNPSSITRVAAVYGGFTVVAGGKVYTFGKDTVNTDAANKKYVYNSPTTYNSVSAYRTAQRTKLNSALAAAGITLSTATDAITYHTTSQDDGAGMISKIKDAAGNEYTVSWSNGSTISQIKKDDNNYFSFNTAGKITYMKKSNASGGTVGTAYTYNADGNKTKEVVTTTLAGSKVVSATRNYPGTATANNATSTVVSVQIGSKYYKLTGGELNNLDLDKIASVEVLQKKILIKTTNNKVYETSMINTNNNGDGTSAQPIVVSGGTYKATSGSGSYRATKEAELRALLQKVGVTPNSSYFTTGFWTSGDGHVNDDNNDLTLDAFKDSSNKIWKIAYNTDGSIKSITRSDNANISHTFTSASGCSVAVSKDGSKTTLNVTYSDGTTKWTLSNLPKDLDETKITRVASYADGRFIVVSDGKVYVCKAGSTSGAKTYDKTVASMQDFQKAEINSLLVNSSIQMNASTATFNSNGFITSFKDTAGATWNVTVSGDGQISKIAKDNNNYVTFNTQTHRATSAKFNGKTYTLTYDESTKKYSTSVTYAGKTNYTLKIDIHNPMSLANITYTQDSTGNIFVAYGGNKLMVGCAKANANAISYVTALSAGSSDNLIGGTIARATKVNNKTSVAAGRYVNMFTNGQYTVITTTTGQYDRYNNKNEKIGYGYTKNYSSTLKFDFVDYRSTRTAYPKVQSNKLIFAKKADGKTAGTQISIASGDSVTVNADGTVTVKKANGTTKKYSITGSVIS